MTLRWFSLLSPTDSSILLHLNIFIGFRLHSAYLRDRHTFSCRPSLENKYLFQSATRKLKLQLPAAVLWPAAPTQLTAASTSSHNKATVVRTSHDHRHRGIHLWSPPSHSFEQRRKKSEQRSSLAPMGESGVTKVQIRTRRRTELTLAGSLCR